MKNSEPRALLEVRGLSLRYPSGTQALNNLSLTVHPGQLVVVLGGNGCGKTTLLRCITRTLTPTQGEVLLNGRDLTHLSGRALRRARLDIAMVWQHAALVRRRSVIANVACGALGRHQTVATAMGFLPRSELAAAVGHLKDVGLDHLAHQRAGTLSGGQAQRVAIARALAQRPGIVLADEPVASLDPEAAQEIMRLLRRLAHADGLAVLCVLHQVDLAFAFADRVIGMRGGQLAFDESSTNISPEAVNQLYLADAA